MRTRLTSLINLSALLIAQTIPLAQSMPASAAPVSPTTTSITPVHSLTASTLPVGSAHHTFTAISPSTSSTPANHIWSAPNLNLAATNSSSAAGNLLGSKTVSINVGGTQLSVNANTLLTPAEKIAVVQVLQSGTQSLLLDSKGSADGGTLTLGSRLSSNLSTLVIPNGVTITDVSKTGTLNLSGNLVDNGRLYLTTNNSSISTFSVSANDIEVGAHGILSTLLASSSPYASTAAAGLGLSLNATNNISNAGTISSGGAITLSAGGSINNSLPQGVGGAQPIIQAANNVSLVSGSGFIVNSGLISSTLGSINLSTLAAATDLTVNASGGTFQALAGSINMRDASYAGSNNINLYGGNYLSQNLNLYSGSGTITGLVGNVSGNLSTQAGAEHFAADTKTLVLENNTVTGDPTFVNTGGDILISGVNTFGEDLAI